LACLVSRAELIRLAQKFLELAGHQPSVDLDAILDEYNAQQMTGRPGDAQPVAQQQQQEQPPKKEE
jgi:hypothetical protein